MTATRENLHISEILTSHEGKGRPLTCNSGTEGEYRYSPTHSQPGARWQWMVNAKLRPLYPMQDPPVSIVLEARRVPQPICTATKKRRISCPASGFEPRTVHPLPSRHTDCAVTDHEMNERSCLQLAPTYTYTAVSPVNSLVITYTPTDPISTLIQALN